MKGPMHVIVRRGEEVVTRMMYKKEDMDGPGGEFDDAKNFFRVFTLGDVLRQDTPVKVFKGTANVGGEPSVFAIKRVRKWRLKNSHKDALFREVQVLKKLHHPNIVEIFRFYRHDPGYYFVVLEFVRGSELFDYVGNKERFTEADARGVCRTLVDATSYLHGEGIVHRDLRSPNILVSVDESRSSTAGDAVGGGFQLKIADFGKACSVKDGPVETLVETPGDDLSPEVLLGRPLSTSVDMWSLGLIASILLSGKHPFFKKDDMARVSLRVVAGDFSLKPEDWNNVSDDAKDFVRRLLTVDVDARMTAEKARTHPWLLGTDAGSELDTLGSSLKELKIFNAKRKVKLAVKMILRGIRTFAPAMSAPSEFPRQYVLGEKIGEGSFGTVFNATAVKEEGNRSRSHEDGDVLEGEPKEAPTCYAVKRIEKKGMDDQAKKEVLQEVEIMRQLNHEHIVSIYDFYEDDPEYFYMVLELMKGGELLDCILSKTFYDEAKARDVCNTVLGALEYIHEQDIVHCDLKPENLLLAVAGDATSIKIADFGLAGSVHNGPLIDGCGTLAYVAPEILKGDNFGKAVDMWSFGVILYVLLSGYQPFRHGNEILLRGMIKNGRFNFKPEQHWKDVSPEAKGLVRELLIVEPEKRLSASEARLHSWLSLPRQSLSLRNLNGSLERLRIFNAKRRLRVAMKMVTAAKKLDKLGNGLKPEQVETIL